MNESVVIIERMSIYGSSSIGAFIFANNDFALLPIDVPTKVEKRVKDALKVNVVRVSVMSSVLLGVLVAGNSQGLLLPKHTLDDEIKALRRELGDVNIALLPSKKNAIGNIVLTNDKAAIVDPELDKRVIKIIEDTLNVETIPMKIAGHYLVGAVAAVSNNGMLVHPLASDDEISNLAKIFRVRVDVGTVNRGSPFIRSGLVVNDRGALVGLDTTGPEIMRIHEIFFSS